MKDTAIVPELGELLENTRRTLLDLRGEHGHWEGELSSSPLSTAIAVVALDEYLRSDALPAANGPIDCLARNVQGGLDWLAGAQNADGGWGDTLLSHSNISTTALVWAAFSTRDASYVETVRRCEAWLGQAAGSLEPPVLAESIAARYGSDRTFSVPILTTLALRDRLGRPADAWTLVPQLPFELAAFPHRWFARLKLPVVSYALPALIAIGQVRHFRRPSRNVIARSIRNLVRARTLNVLEGIQPSSGGFLEATPLTSFVILSLICAGEGGHAVVGRGVDFLARSVREDGSWPIDTNLATWVTTLAVNAISSAGSANSLLESGEIRRILDWLTSQQFKVQHPYTHAAPGGWAWTDLPGGVPDADDTPGALLALWNLAGSSAAAAASAGVRWLLDLQNSDGGLPTFCRGWGVLPFDRSSPDLTAHALRAWWVWQDHLSPSLQKRLRRGADRALHYLGRAQRPDGAWAPLWFGNQYARSEENLTYGTSRVLLSLTTASFSGPTAGSGGPDASSALSWLMEAQNSDGGWGGAGDTPSSIEETALALESLGAAMSSLAASDDRSPPRYTTDELAAAISRGLRWLAVSTSGGKKFDPTPIGFYFAKLWYYERLYPITFTLAALGQALHASQPPALSARVELPMP